jgi:hypothetical protein
MRLPMAYEDATYLSAEAEAELRAKNIEEAADRWYHLMRDVAIGVWDIFRFVLFALFALLAVLYFWLWMFSAFSFLLRLVLRVIMLPLLWLSDGTPRREGEPMGVPEALALDLKAQWANRDRTYLTIARPLARAIVTVQETLIRFWHFNFAKKVFTLVLAFWTIFVPGLFIVPRPHYVQLINNDAIDYGSGGATDVRYLVHAVDLFDPSNTREYMNEPAWWFGKLNAQGLKNRLHKGEYYKMWIVGIRWWYMPTLYPNIIWVSEVDRSGKPIDDENYMVPEEEPEPPLPPATPSN